MTATFPTDLPNVKTNFDGATSVASSFQNQQGEEINALAAKVGKDSSAVTTSHDYKLSGVTGTDKAASLTGSETLSNKTFVSPILGTPSSGVLTNCTGTASGLTAGNVTTNANLTGPITSSGNATTVGLTAFSVLNAPQGYLINGKIVPSVASDNLTVAIKGIDGNDPSATNPIYVRIGDTIRSITSALSVTASAGTNLCQAGSAELATKEIDWFVYLGWNVAQANIVLAFSRIPYAQRLDDFDYTNETLEKSAKFSAGIAGYTVSDPYENIGRFAATLSAGAGYTWTVPTFTATNLIQRPIYETRWLTWVPTIVGWTSASTNWAKYKIGDHYIIPKLSIVTSASNSTSATATLPLAVLNYPIGFSAGIDNGTILTTPAKWGGTPASATITFYKDWSNAAWTDSGNKGNSIEQQIIEI
jgi:hypothetical protein